ncbi:hypothetical protein [Seleniivibrio sp.]|uniref:hypothetical protein n=1 Tax=Seleniivibrio sp. TaxID=2898801 RepID=UPI0025F5D340|nr:hypothetical protein [Seleniivibrio sp.]MCD8554001.1 hypothetical protein [Seleniivibrio sp.]
MIVGKGLFANAMKSIDRGDTIFFCSGVSNSSETDKNNFLREENLLMSFKCTANKLIYFSSYFVNFDNYTKQLYYRHKKNMELLVAENFENYTIFRLPQVVGKCGNIHTLTNYLHSKISAGEKVNIFKNAKRNLLDIDDVTLFVSYILEKGLYANNIVSFAEPVSHSVSDIVDAFETILGLKIEKDFVSSLEEPYRDVVDKDVLEICKNLGIVFDETYIERLLKKYYGK